MLRLLNNFFRFSVCLCVVLTSCVKKEFEDFYKRPDNLADPIYQQLVSRGNFTGLLKCIDKAGYKETLSSGGYWTFFAANDEAFNAFLAENNMASADQISEEMARKIVTYNLVYNAYQEEDLLKYQAPGQGTSLEPEFATKRKTAYYDFVYPAKVGADTLNVVNTNRNGGLFVESDNNNKYMPYFIKKALDGKQVPISDYQAFFPGVTYNDFNVMEAQVVEKDVAAENGIIHFVDKVLMPLENIDSYIAADDQYSEFKKLLDLAAIYTRNDNLTKRYQAISKSSDSVYVKSYAAGLAFAPNNENFLTSGTDAQINGYTLFAPTNAELLTYTQKVLKHYGSFEAAPQSILYDFLNAHMWLTQVWPSKINLEGNSAGETPNFNQAAIFERKVLSNGFFYGMNSVQQPNVFRTLYGFAYLNPDFLLMKRALDAGLRPLITIPAAKFTIFMMSDEDVRATGYDYYDDQSNWGYQAPGGSLDVSDNARAKILRIVETSVVPTMNNELDDLSGKGIVEAYNGEYIKYDGGKVWASGNVETNIPVIVKSSETAINGKAYYTDNILTFTESSLLVTLENLANQDPDNFDYFYELYKIYANQYTSAPSPIALGGFYTLLAPNNAAISQAVKDGKLPGNTTSGVPNFGVTSSGDIGKLKDFINYHVLDKNTIASDGKKEGIFPTLLKNNDGDIQYVTVLSPAKDNLSFKDINGTTVTINLNKSNNLAFRTLIHSLNSYLKY